MQIINLIHSKLLQVLYITGSKYEIIILLLLSTFQINSSKFNQTFFLNKYLVQSSLEVSVK